MGLRTLGFSLLALIECTPAPRGEGITEPAVSVLPSSPRATPAPLVSSAASAALDAATTTQRPAASGAIELSTSPDLTDAQGNPLSQTEDEPQVTSPALRERLTLLVRAIAEDRPEIATPAFFPKIAYEQVKDIKRPGIDWDRRLMKAFARDIHRYHTKLGDQAASASFAGLSVDPKRVKWMAPGKEGNKLGYFRVTRNKLHIGLASGQTREVELTSLISWRGEWYVVHLSGFK